MAKGDSMVVRPDGKIVLTGETWPNFAALARLEPDGSLDSGFGEGGFVVDRRLPVLTALAAQPDGRIVAVGVGGYQLSRYLSSGRPIPSSPAAASAGRSIPSNPTSSTRTKARPRSSSVPRGRSSPPGPRRRR
jgi:hypothetical protein